MCTVSFIPVKNRFFITSNRDEKIRRKPASPPGEYQLNDIVVMCPKDTDRGGSWIAMNQFGHAAVLLNGAFQKHVSLPPYENSRGLVFTDIIASRYPFAAFLDRQLKRVEPFTLIILQNGHLYECRWDGSEKHTRKLPVGHSRIWSSATLYDTQMKEQREHWFTDFLENHPAPAQDEILHFHRFAVMKEKPTGLPVNCNDQLITVSITSMEITPSNGRMMYMDLVTGEQDEKNFHFSLNKSVS